MRLSGISTIEQANTFLRETYLPGMNRKFSRLPRKAEDAHVKLGTVSLDDILCMEHDRIVSMDYIVRFECRLFQILPEATPKPQPGDAVLVRVRWKNNPLLVKEIKTMFVD